MAIHIERSALLPYTSEQLYGLVNDVLRYPEFLPWCYKTELLESTETKMRARLHIGKGPIKHSFVTCNTLVSNKTVEINLEEGPFKHLHGLWTFTELNDKACKISLSMDFDYSNILIKTALGPLFNIAASNMVNVFCQRAKELYGHH